MIDYRSYLDVLIQNKYVTAIATLVFFLFLAKVVLYIFKKYLAKLAKKTATTVDDLIVEKIETPVVLIIALGGFNLALFVLEFGGKFGFALKRITDSVIIIIITYIFVVVIDIIIDVWGTEWAKRTKSRIDDDVIPLLHKFSRIVITIFGFIYILKNWGVEIGPLLASLGIAGIAIGFAVQDSLKNIFGGISLILDKNVKVGDTVKFESGETGKILDVGLRSTKVRTWDNEIMIIPNGKLANTILTNYALPDLSARHHIKFGVEYGSDPKKVKEVVLKAVKSIEEVVDDPEPFIRFKEMADFSLNFKVYFWVADYRLRFMVEDKAVSAIYNALNKAGIGIPFPIRTVYLKKKK